MNTNTLDLTLISKDGVTSRGLAVERLIVAGWTGRDPVAVEKHIAELEELGVTRPTSAPIFYRVSKDRLTTASSIQVSGPSSSGEVEWILANIDGDIWVGVGSDHTDREVETYGVTVSKQMCEKPMAPELWALSEIEDHWDALTIRSYAVDGDDRNLYQEGTVDAMLGTKDLLDRFAAHDGAPFQPGDVMLGGTLAAIGGIRSAQRFEFELVDPVLNRRIAHGYNVESLPIAG